MPGESTLPAELDLLPSAGKVAGTEGYKPHAFMGLVELTDCLYAEYSLDGEEPWQGFVVLPEASASVWEGLSAEWASTEIGALTAYYREVPYLGFMGVVRTDRGLFGVSGSANEVELQERLGRFLP